MRFSLKSRNLLEVRLETPVFDPAKQLDEQETQEILSKLPGALFEKVVFRFDQDNIVPGREAPQTTRAIELVKLVRFRTNGIAELWEFLQSNTNTSHPLKINNLVGILMPPKEKDSEVAEEIARYAFAQVKKSISSDIFSNPDEGIMSTLVWNLENLSPNPDKHPEILEFAVLCHDHATGLGKEEMRKQLSDWIVEACANTLFTLESIRALLPRQDYSRRHRLSIEIAWDEPIITAGKKNFQLEAYIRWGRLRQRIDQFNMSSDAYKEVTRLLESLKDRENLDVILVDHVELVLDPIEMHHLWEYKDRSATDIDTPEWQPYPVVVRSNQKNNKKNLRACPKHVVLPEHIACNKDDREQFLTQIQDQGVFVTTKYESEDEKPCRTIRDAISWASIGIWTRKTFDDDNQLRDVLVNYQVEDIPSRIHSRRAISDAGSIWRNIVVLFDPNLPPFKFSYELHGSNSQHKTNTALKNGFQNQ